MNKFTNIITTILESTEDIFTSVTSLENYESMEVSNTIKPLSYWSNNDYITDYYIESYEDDEEEIVLLRIPRSKLLQYQPEPDYPSIEEPLSNTLNTTDEDIHERWANSKQDVDASIDIVGSLRARVDIPLDNVSVEYY